MLYAEASSFSEVMNVQKKKSISEPGVDWKYFLPRVVGPERSWRRRR